MFDFLLKRPAPDSPSAPETASKDDAGDRAATAQAKLAAQQQADALGQDEAAAAQFILQCEFADVRLSAAEHIHAKPILTQVRQAMLNADRRVAKLMQTRLDAIEAQEAQREHIQACLQTAQRLLQDASLTPNLVADLDRSWLAMGAISTQSSAAATAFKDDFDGVRALLGQRLAAQAGLQRGVIDALAQLHATIAAASTQTPDARASVMAELARRVDGYRSSPEIASLPRHLLTQFDDDIDRFKQTLSGLDQQHDALKARRQALDNWESTPIPSLKVEALRRTWQGLGAIEDEAMAPLQARFETLVGNIQEAQKSKDAASNTVTQDAKKTLGDTLAALEAALQEGLLHAASEYDKSLRAMDFKAARPSPSHTARLGNARAELKRLQDWAKWGGNVSREELIKAVEELGAQGLGVAELGKKVGSSRERWKALDIASGPAPKSLWERFDASCTSAYEPVAAHFKKLAEERRNNLAKAQGLLADIAQYSSATAASAGLDREDAADIDWKNIAAFCQRTSQAWQRLGPIDRKEKKRIDRQFDTALQGLLTPLSQQRAAEVKQREKLIVEATQLNPNDRSALDALRALQERWQVQAKALPLERHEEQALWQRFRSACDAVFTQRKQSADAADSERKHNLAQKEALCAHLETSLADPEQAASQTALAKLLRDSKAAWSAIGQVPRAREQASEKRYLAAVSALQKQIDEHKRSQETARANAMRDKLSLCHKTEAALAANGNIDDSWTATWQALPVLSGEYERSLQKRFDAAMDALRSHDHTYMEVLQKNGPALSLQLLRLEIAAGLESPPELSKERLKMQIEVLQSSLKSGQKPGSQQAQLLALCSLPALVDAASAARIEQVLKALPA